MEQLVSRIRRFFDAGVGTFDEAELDLDLAAATLLLEIAWADHDVDPREEEVATQQLRVLFPEGSESDLDLLVSRARETLDGATALHPFTSAVNSRASLAEKHNLLTALWRVALADGKASPVEEHLIRKVADLLYLNHRGFITAKLAARGEPPTAAS